MTGDGHNIDSDARRIAFERQRVRIAAAAERLREQIDSAIVEGRAPDMTILDEPEPQEAILDEPEPAEPPDVAEQAEALALPGLAPVSPSAPSPRSLRSTPPWLPRALREMAARDPHGAGRLLLSLLPAHGLVEPERDLSYDLLVDEVGCLAVTLSGGEVSIDERPRPRPAGEVDFQIAASLAGLGLLLAAPRARRMLTRERAAVTPDRERARTLRLLAEAPLGLRALHAAGVRLDPMLAYRALAISIEPQWTAGRRFTLVHEVEGSAAHRCCVYVDGQRPVSVSGPSRHTNATVTVLCPPELFLPLLAGELTREAERRLVHGDIEAFTALQDWIARIEWAGAYGG